MARSFSLGQQILSKSLLRWMLKQVSQVIYKCWGMSGLVYMKELMLIKAMNHAGVLLVIITFLK